MRGVKQVQESTGRMKKHRYSKRSPDEMKWNPGIEMASRIPLRSIRATR